MSSPSPFCLQMLVDLTLDSCCLSSLDCYPGSLSNPSHVIFLSLSPWCRKSSQHASLHCTQALLFCHSQSPGLTAPQERSPHCCTEEPQPLLQTSSSMSEQWPDLVEFAPCDLDSIFDLLFRSTCECVDGTQQAETVCWLHNRKINSIDGEGHS